MEGFANYPGKGIVLLGTEFQMIAVSRKASLGVIAGSVLIALGVAVWFIATASDGLRRLPYFLRQPEHRARLLHEFDQGKAGSI